MLLEELYCRILYWAYIWYFHRYWLTCSFLSSNITDGAVFAGRKFAGTVITTILWLSYWTATLTRVCVIISKLKFCITMMLMSCICLGTTVNSLKMTQLFGTSRLILERQILESLLILERIFDTWSYIYISCWCLMLMLNTDAWYWYLILRWQPCHEKVKHWYSYIH